MNRLRPLLLLACCSFLFACQRVDVRYIVQLCQAHYSASAALAVLVWSIGLAIEAN